jgi:MFS family permease
MADKGLWANRNWRLFWTGQTISMLGDWVFDTTVVLWVATRIAKGETWAPLAVGGVLAAALVPVVLVGPFAGVFVDRWDRRRTMLATDLIRAGLILGLLILLPFEDGLSQAAQLTTVYAVVALAAAASQFFNGSRFGVLAAVVPPDDQPRASGAVQSSAALAGIIGPPLAAPLLFTAGVGWALAINAASFLVSFATVAAMRGVFRSESEAAGREESFWREFREGVRYFAGNRVLRALLISVMVVTVGVGAVNALDVFFVTDNLHADAGNLGVLSAAISIGTLAGALCATIIGNRVKPATMFWIMLIATGAVLIGYARTTSMLPAAIILGLAGIPLGLLNSSGGPMLLQSTPRSLIGRVMAVFNPFQQVAGIAGMLLATYLASNQLRDLDATVAGVHFGRIDSIFVVAGLLFIGAGIWAIRPLGTFAPVEKPTDPAVEAEIQPLVPEGAAAPRPPAALDQG